MHLFLSHISEESTPARSLKVAIEKALPGVEVFVSAVDIHYGDQWLKVIDEAMLRSKAVLPLCSPRSVRRPWINFESGSGWARRLPVIPICYRGLTVDQLPDPLGIFQAIELNKPDEALKLITRISREFDIPITSDFDPSIIIDGLKMVDPARTTEIGIIQTHRQTEWEKINSTIINLPEPLPEEMKGNWKFRQITNRKAFLSEELNILSGLILASPWRSKLEPETIGSIVEWVHKGGRLLLLGFELGDRHHMANLAELSHHFGIDTGTDIVGPPDFSGSKPYDVTVDFEIANAEPHHLTTGIKNIKLANVQTVRVEPGGIEWLRVGKNVVHHPKRENVIYRDGAMTAPGGDAFYKNESAGWLPVAVEAPAGLCGRGGVMMIGTWDLFGRRKPFGGENLLLVTRILNWLSGLAK